MRGYCAIGVYHPKAAVNCGTLWRSAFSLGAAAMFTIGERFPEGAWRNMVRADPALGQPSDTCRAWLHMPYLRFEDVEALRQGMPLCDLVAVELADNATLLPGFHHPERAVYLLGAEDHGLPRRVLEACDQVVQIPSRLCLNVAVAGTTVLYDRTAKATERMGRTALRLRRAGEAELRERLIAAGAA